MDLKESSKKALEKLDSNRITRSIHSYQFIVDKGLNLPIYILVAVFLYLFFKSKIGF